MDAKLPMETFETVFALASEGCKAIAERVREVKAMEFLNPFFVPPLKSILCFLKSLVLLFEGTSRKHQTARVSSSCINFRARERKQN